MAGERQETDQISFVKQQTREESLLLFHQVELIPSFFTAHVVAHTHKWTITWRGLLTGGRAYRD